GTEHYVELASEIIQELDSSPAREMRTRVYRLKNAQAAEIQTALASFLEQRRQRLAETLGSEALGAAQRQLEDTVAIVAETASNSLLLSASPRTFDEIAELIEDLDQPQPQVLIQALLAEVTLDDALDLGTEWNLASELDGTPYETGTDFGVPLDLTAAGGFFATVTGGEVSFLIRALEADGRLEVLSRPQILAADNMRAEINIGQRVPQVTGSVTTELGNINNTIEYREVGVILRVTPRIGPDGFVTMEVEPEISSLSQSSVDFGTGVSAPVFNERRAVTTVSVQNGHTIVIGGLISTTDDVREEGIPILKDIPLLGYLFKSRKLTKVRTELLIILTPHVITGVEHADWITDETVRASGFAGRPGRDAMQENLLRELERPSRPRDLPGDENAIYGPPIDGGRRKED
ncbi:MAG TPA: secretin N-terminal domain-containing protein, partial [Planctomycetota bacterium]|nr:secretin N-terminal domain-containing protein [Planctomycetota bacterium]